MRKFCFIIFLFFLMTFTFNNAFAMFPHHFRNQARILSYSTMSQSQKNEELFRIASSESRMNASNLALMASILEHGANINQVDNAGHTALFWAARSNNPTMVEALLAQGAAATINHVNNSGNTPLIMAVQFGNLAMVEALLAHGAAATINHVNNSENTALIMAALNNYPAIIEILLTHGAATAINQASSFGNTALILAAQNNNLRMVATFLDHGAVATINHANNNGRTAMMLAESHNNLAMVATLLAHGAVAINNPTIQQHDPFLSYPGIVEARTAMDNLVPAQRDPAETEATAYHAAFRERIEDLSQAWRDTIAVGHRAVPISHAPNPMQSTVQQWKILPRGNLHVIAEQERFRTDLERLCALREQLQSAPQIQWERCSAPSREAIGVQLLETEFQKIYTQLSKSEGDSALFTWLDDLLQTDVILKDTTVLRPEWRRRPFPQEQEAAITGLTEKVLTALLVKTQQNATDHNPEHLRSAPVGTPTNDLYLHTNPFDRLQFMHMLNAIVMTPHSETTETAFITALVELITSVGSNNHFRSFKNTLLDVFSTLYVTHQFPNEALLQHFSHFALRCGHMGGQ